MAIFLTRYDTLDTQHTRSLYMFNVSPEDLLPIS